MNVLGKEKIYVEVAKVHSARLWNCEETRDHVNFSDVYHVTNAWFIKALNECVH